MKLSVAFLLILAVFSSATLTQTARRSNQPGVSKPRIETMTICQGVPLPNGYVIIAYMSSSACPHGAYVLKKQTDYERSLAMKDGARAVDNGSSTAAGSKSSESSASPSVGVRKQPARDSTARSSGASSQMTSPPFGDSEKPTGQSLHATRARRVETQAQNTTQSPEDVLASGVPPSLIGAAAPGPLRPPTLTNQGYASAPSSPIQSSDAGAAQSGPEEVSEGDVVRVDTTLVRVPVSVLDRQGRFIPNLKREDFTVFENDVEQSIAYFEPAEMPFTVALMLDTSPSTHFHLLEIKEAAIEFAKKLRPQDRVLIVSFNEEVLLLTEATNDLNVIEAVIEENANTGSSTRLYDAVDLTIKERLNKIKGRKAIVLFTDGVDTSSQQASYKSTLDEAEELDALIYPVQYDTTDYLRAMQSAGSGVTVVTTTRGPFGISSSRQVYNSPINGGLPLPGTSKEDYARADRYLRSLADKTGGRLYEANDTTQLAQAFTGIAEELRRQYSLGYYPKNDPGDVNRRRQIRVKVRQPDVAVKARNSYTKPSADPVK